MATLLYRLGRFSFRRAWVVIGAWALALLVIVGGGFALGGKSQESFVIPGTESQTALDHLGAVFPQVAGASVQVVTVAPDGDTVDSESSRAALEKQAEALRAVDGVNTVMAPFDEYAGTAISADKKMARTQVQFTDGSESITDAKLDEVTATASITRDAGLVSEFGGQVFQQSTFGITITEVFGVVFAAIVLIVTFGSLLAAGMPLLSALIGVGIVIGGITGVSAFTEVSSSAPLLALMIGLAVGIDYALFILSRHRTQLAQGETPEESAAMAVGTAGGAVVFAGVTVIIALLGLLVVQIPFLSVMGIGAAFAVLVAIGVATTLLPALMGLAGARLAPKPGSRSHRRALASSDETARPSMGRRWVRGVLRVPWVAAIAVVGILGVLAIPAASLDLNLPDNGSEAADSTQRKAYDLISEGFGPGYNGPLIVSVDITQTVDVMDDLAAVSAKLATLDDIAEVTDGLPDETLDTGIIQVIPASAPDSAETKALVEAIREMAPEIDDEFGTPIAVTGITAVGIDISQRLADALIPFALVVVGLSIVLLMMVFRSVLVPVKAAVGFLLSVASSFGVVVAVFQWGWGSELIGVENPGPILSFMPILLMAVLFGLAMDYEVFLVSGMREEYVRTGNARFSIERGFTNGARVVTAAALIMFFVFFAFVPQGFGMIKPIALGLAIGIAFDALLVRMTLVPAVMAILGRAAWWMPAWLSRVLPHADIEGEGLREHREAMDWTRTQTELALSAEGLQVGTSSALSRPMDVAVAAGEVLLVSGDRADRLALLGSLSGRSALGGGRAQVLGHPLPSHAAQVRRMVAVTAIGGDSASDSVEGPLTVGELLRERMRLTQRSNQVRAERVEHWVARITEVLRTADRLPAVPLSADTGVAELGEFDRAVVRAAAALAERAPVLMVDVADAFADSELSDGVVAAICALAPASTTVVVASAVPTRAVDVTGVTRPSSTLDLYTTHRTGVLL